MTNNNEQLILETTEPTLVFGFIFQSKGPRKNLDIGLRVLVQKFPNLAISGIHENTHGLYSPGWRAYCSFSVIEEGDV